MLAGVFILLVGPPKPDRSKGRGQTQATPSFGWDVKPRSRVHRCSPYVHDKDPRHCSISGHCTGLNSRTRFFPSFHLCCLFYSAIFCFLGLLCPCTVFSPGTIKILMWCIHSLYGHCMRPFLQFLSFPTLLFSLSCHQFISTYPINRVFSSLFLLSRYDLKCVKAT